MKTRKKPFRLLIVEDDQDRIRFLHCWLPEEVKPVVATSAGKALTILRLDGPRGEYAGILLDYNLEKQAVTKRDQELSGKEVYHAVMQYVSLDVPLLVHSNASISDEIRKLEKRGFWVTHIPFHDLSRQRLREWLGEVCENWEDLEDA
ncbi:hypothetical protein [Desulforhabdus sp. TSK]|uniref:hypothetical protein n=1 Tax=Desulforhabdus sp. TSK TaxID=2925014 RepID=UPI001FC87628|nr:hypothetical protein [Desulforhabdus sp. TSK]GKT09120.1 hypothetical protein DSTSK_24250 [Desulforhabdus sp. TSK]